MEKEIGQTIYFAPDGSLAKSFRVRIVIELLMFVAVVFIILRYKSTFLVNVGIIIGSSLTAWLFSELISPSKKIEADTKTTAELLQ